MNIKPEEVKQEDEQTEYTRTSQQGDSIKPTEIYLPKNNTKIPAGGTVNKPSQIGNYTTQYMG